MTSTIKPKWDFEGVLTHGLWTRCRRCEKIIVGKYYGRNPPPPEPGKPRSFEQFVVCAPCGEA